ncbi:MAG: alanine racemase [Deltaproteobacteria bacterium]|nr:MAG: alanine racemase [Deltaproteobacteria bacterium]
MPDTLHEPVIAMEGVLRPTRLEVDLDALADNLAAIRRRVGAVDVMPVLKANAYGHGLVAVGRLMQALGVPCIGLAYLEEGIRLRRAGVDTPILVLGGILGSQIPAFLEHDLTLTASSVDKLRAIEDCAATTGRRARVHLKIDTGMERIGVHWYSAETLLEESLRCRHVEVEGIFTHLANADAADPGHARLQLERFAEVLSFYDRRGLPRPRCHAANSGGVLQLPESWLDMVRPGILMYGVFPSSEVARTVPVRPALTWTSRVVYFKVVRPHSPVSYGSTWAPDRLTRIVTVPVGYGDGYMRSMSGQAQVLIRGRRYPVVGRICMDQLMVDIGWDSAYNDDEVVLLGARGDQRVTVEELATWAGTIPYEVLTNINTRVPRVYVGRWAERLGLTRAG